MSNVRKVIWTLVGMWAIIVCASVLMGAADMQKASTTIKPEQPIIEELSPFRGGVFKNFAEFRVQRCYFSLGGVLFLEDEPYAELVNINSIVKVHRFRDGDETEFSSLMFIAEAKYPKGIVPVLVREDYDDILRRIKKAIESR